MSKTPSDPIQNSKDELLAEYRFDYQKAEPNRFAALNQTQQAMVVVLDRHVGRGI